LRIFEDWFETYSLAVDRELSRARRGQFTRGSKNRRDIDHLRRIVGNPLRVYPIRRVRRVPLQAVKAGAGGGLRVFDSEPVTLVAMNHDNVDAAERELRGVRAIVSEE